MVEDASGQWWCAGSEEQKGRAGSVDSRYVGVMQRRSFGWGRREKIDRNDALMAKREADLAIMVFGYRLARGARGRQAGCVMSGLRMIGERVMMAGEQDRLNEDRENAGKRGGLARNVPSPGRSEPP